MENAKNIRNPNGKKGKEDHQAYIRELVGKLLSKFRDVAIEDKIVISKNKRRYSDISVYDENGNRTEIHQVGRTNKDGSPVARERRAIADIERATGIKVIFHALKVLIFLLVMGLIWFRVF